jgi:hypothetical protein
MGKPLELTESLLGKGYDPGDGRVVEITTETLAERMRERAQAISSFAGAEAAELREAASRIAEAGGRTVRLAAMDAAALMGARGAFLAR